MEGPAQTVLLHGGARSGKSQIIVAKILERAQRFAGSRHLIARYRLLHARTSIWHETLLPLIRNIDGWKVHISDLYLSFENGSEIWLGGFDDPDRIEKMLGHEYCTIYPNEISQISYDAFILARSRLAQHVPGCKNMALLDCNPPSPQHWSHKLFFDKVEPRGNIPLLRPQLYAQMQINPRDNKGNLPPRYIQDVLASLPEKERRRFLDGEWVKPAGTIFYAFDDDMIVEVDDLPNRKDFESFTVGVDFGMNCAAGLIGWMGDTMWFLEDYGGFNLTAANLNTFLLDEWRSCWKSWDVAWCDPAGGERISDIMNGDKADNAVEDGINWLNSKMEHGEFRVSRKCAGFLSEVYDYRRDDKGRILKMNDHYCDAFRYGSYSNASHGIGLYV